MRIIFMTSVLILTFTACRQHVQKPVWVNAASTITLPGDSLVFSSTSATWLATLLSFTQPVQLRIHAIPGGFSVQPDQETGYTGGPAHLLLQLGNTSFQYHFFLKNKSAGLVTAIDLRSPKTLNPDSTLQQQQMLSNVDEWRNLLPDTTSNLYFKEKLALQAPAAGSFRAQRDKPLSAWYVQPGSCTSIPLSAVFVTNENRFKITAGPCFDAYQNTVANGTLVRFICNDGKTMYTTEVAMLNGFATFFTNEEMGAAFLVQAQVHETFSKKLRLKK